MSEDNSINSISFNQNSTLFCVGNNEGFNIYNAYPYSEQVKCPFENAIGNVELIYRSNLVGIVGGGSNPRYPNNKVIIWDDYRKSFMGELSFRSEVRALKLKKEHIVIVCDNKVFVYRFNNFRIMNFYDTHDNPHGTVALSYHDDANYLAIPSVEVGKIKIIYYLEDNNITIYAHENRIICLEFSYDGSLLGSCSDNGHLIKIWDTKNGQLKETLRRGTTNCMIFSLAFSYDNKYVACASDHNSIHVWTLEGRNTRSTLAMLSPIRHEWSLIKIEFKFAGGKLFKIAFNEKNNSQLFVITKTGYYASITLDYVSKSYTIDNRVINYINETSV